MRNSTRKSLNVSNEKTFKTTSFRRNSIVSIIAIFALTATAAVSFGVSAESISRALRAGFFGPASEAALSPNVADSSVQPVFASSAITAIVGETLLAARSGHTATVLADGRVLIAGGDSVGSSETFDPVTGLTSTSGNMNAPRSGHTATRLSDGRVLIAGGASDASTEIYDPANGTFSYGSSLTAPRNGHTATTLADGRIVIIGGDAAGSVEIFDPASESFSSVAANLSALRSNHSAALLQDGNILIVGGTAADSSPVLSGEIFDPAASSFSSTANSLKDGRSNATLNVLADGKVQIIGGSDHGTMEMYDPAINEFGAHVHVFPIGDDHPELIQEILDSPTRAALFHHGASSPLLDREGQTITELAGNAALVVGGTDGSGAVLSSTAVLNSSQAAITTDKLDYAPGTPVIVSGYGFAPNEAVTLMFHEDPHVDTENPHTFIVQADTDGNFVDQQYAPEEADLGVAFILAAKGGTSGWTAQTAFTDARNWTLNFAGTGSGSVKITPSSGTINAPVSCGGTGTAVASQTVTGTCAPNITTSDNGATVTFEASPASGSLLSGWSSPVSLSSSTCTGTTNPCSAVLGGSASLTVTFTSTIGTNTSVDSSANPSVFGQPVTFTATVSRASGSPSPTGSVQFKIDSVNHGSPVTLSSVNATTATATSNATSGLSAGSHVVTAEYIPTGVFAASMGTLAGGQVVNKADTSTTVSSDHLDPLAWTQIFPTGGGPSLSTCGQTTHTDNAGRLIVYARTVCGGGTGEVWVQNGANGLGGTPTWSLVASGGPSRHAQTDTYDQANNKLILFGGCSGGCFPVNNDVWVLSNANGQGGAAVWTQLFPTGTPPAARNNATGAYDPITNRLMIFGGQDGSGTVVGHTFADVWVLSNANGTGGTPVWTKLTTAGSFPLGQYISRAFYDSANNRLTVAGGLRADNGALSSAVNVLTNANGLGGTPTWSNLIAEGAAGAPAFANWAVDYDKGANRGILSESGTPNLFYLNNVNGLGGPTTYTHITPSGGAGAAPTGGLALDVPSGRIMAFYQSGSNLSFFLDGSSSSNFGESVTFTANVSVDAPGAGTPSGTVQFFDGATPIGGPQTVSGGIASVSTSLLMAGSHNITAEYSGDDSFNMSTSTSFVHTVDKADQEIVFDPLADKTYGDPAFNVSATGGDSGEPVMFAAGPVGVCTSSGTNGATITITGAGLCTVTASQAGNVNYNAAPNVDQSFTVNKATLTASIIGNPTKPYDGNTDAVLAPANFSLSGLVGTDSFTVTRTTGSYNDPNVALATTVSTALAAGDFAPDGVTLAANYNLPTTASGPGSIIKADANCSISGFSGTFDALPHGASGTCTGVLAETLTGLDLGASFTNVPGGTVNWVFTDVTDNYNDDSGSVEIEIIKANAVCTISGFTGTYDAAPHGATGSCVGVTADPTAAGSSLDLGASFTDVPGGTATWAFSGGANYNDQGDDVAIVINRADAAVNVVGFTGTYDAAAHGAGGTATGVLSEDLSGLFNFGATFTNVPGGTANWTFNAGNTNNNYNSASGAVDIIINRANATINVVGFTGTYDAAAHGAGGTATGVLSEDLSGLFNFGATFTNVPGGTANWTFNAGNTNNNYNSASGAVDIIINRANADCTITGYDVTYDGNPHTATGSCLGVLGETLAGLDLSGTTHTNASAYPGDPWTFTDLTGNYNNADGTVDDNIDKAPLTASIVADDKIYDGNDTATFICSLAGVIAPDDVICSGGSATFASKNVGVQTVTGTGLGLDGADAGNYSLPDTTATDDAEITVRFITVTAVTDTKTYDGTPSSAATPTVGAPGIATGDTGSFTQAFDIRNVGASKTLTPAGSVDDGNGGNNYSITFEPVNLGTIEARAITVSAVTDSKEYDGTTSSDETPSVGAPGIATGDTAVFTQAFNNKNADTGKTLIPSGTVNDGNGGNNYAITFANNLTGVITQKPITVTAVTDTKVFDFTTASSGEPSIAPGLATGDTENFIQTFDTQFVGTGKTLTPSGTVIDGNSGNNYAYTFVPVNTGEITTTCSVFDGFMSPIGGANAFPNTNGSGGNFMYPIRTFKLNSTIPFKFSATCFNEPLLTGIHTLRAIKYSNATTSTDEVIAVATDAATTGNQFRLTDGQWHFNFNTKGLGNAGQGTWLFEATLFDGSKYNVWLAIKK